MLEKSFECLFTSATTMTIGAFLICIGTAVALGIVIALVYTFKAMYTRSFVVTVALLPAIVTVVIMMVGGNLGAGVAVAGTFSLVRFRTLPGTAKEICFVFLSMATGLACGMGYASFAAVFVAIVCVVSILLALINFGGRKNEQLRKQLRITMPEDLDYGDVYQDLLEKYTVSSVLTQVKTTNLGSLNKLTYDVVLRKAGTEKVFIDELRCRNGNLEISIGALPMDGKEL